MKISPIAMFALVASGVGVIFTLKGSNEPDVLVPLQEPKIGLDAPAATNAERTTSDEQLATLIARFTETQTRLQNLEAENKELHTRYNKENGKSQDIIVDSVINKLNKTGVFDLGQKVDSKLLEVENSLRSLHNRDLVDEVTYGNDGSEYGVTPALPKNLIGGGQFSKPNLVQPNIEHTKQTHKFNALNSTSWLMPVDAVLPVDPKKGTVSYAFDSQKIAAQNFGSSPFASDRNSIPNDLEAVKPEKIKFGTIAQESTLVDAVTMTALIGRIPVKGKLVDPYEFKVLIGKENLAANGLYIPNLERMIMRGVAKGDYTGQCVSGDIVAATYVFNDGRIQTINSSDVGRSRSDYDASGQITQERLGWISTQGGTPCISGAYISDASKFIATQAGLSALGAVAAGYAASAKVTEGVGDDKETTITDSTKYALGQGGLAATDNVTGWINDIKESAFGLVFVESNERIAIHITKELHIDYDPVGRKLTYNEDFENAQNFLD